MFSQFPASVVAFMVDIAELTPREALTIAIVRSVQ
jgi:hypothetical protein